MNLVVGLLLMALNIYQYIVLARVIITWLPIDRNNAIVNLLFNVTEPVLAPIRNIIEKYSAGRNMMFDFSPIVVFLLIGIIRSILSTLIGSRSMF